MDGSQEWSIGQLAEVDVLYNEQPVFTTNAWFDGHSLWHFIGRKGFVRPDGCDASWVTAVRPLRLVAQDAVVMAVADPAGFDAPEAVYPNRWQACAADQSQPPVPRDRLAGSDETIEALAQRIGHDLAKLPQITGAALAALAVGRAGQHTPAGLRERVLTVIAGRVIAAAEPVIAARVRAEAVAEERRRIIDALVAYGSVRLVEMLRLNWVIPFAQIVKIIGTGFDPAEPAERHVCSGTPCSTQHHAFYGQLCNVPNCVEDFCIGTQESSVGTPKPVEQPPFEWRKGTTKLERLMDEAPPLPGEPDPSLIRFAAPSVGTGTPTEAVSGSSGHAERQETTQRHHLFGYCWCGSVHGEKRQVEALNAARPDELLRSARGEIERLTAEVVRYRAAIEAAVRNIRDELTDLREVPNIDGTRYQLGQVVGRLAAALGDGE